MSDFDSSLPVRTENNGDVASRIVDGTITSQALTVNADGSINVTDNGGSLTVDGVNFDIRDLAFATDKVDVSGSTVDLSAGTLAALESITVQNPAGAGAVNIQDGGNSITVDGTVTVSNFPTTVDTNYGTVGASTIRTASQIGNATGAANFNAGATGAQTLRVEANQGAPATVANSWPVKLTDGTDTVAVNTDGSLNVVITDATPGTSVNDYKRAVAIAAGATDNHDYTVTSGKTLYLNQIEGSGSGKTKMQVSIETGVASGVFVDRWSQFNSTSTPNMTIHIDNPISVAAGVRVRTVMTNKDLAAQDMYSTISGYELP